MARKASNKTSSTSNKAAGRAVNALDNATYVQAMGGTVMSVPGPSTSDENALENLKNTGLFFTNSQVYKYFKLLRNYYLNRIKWSSDRIPQHELRLIEWNIFHYGRCAMLRPRITKNGVRYRSPNPKIYQCTFNDINFRTGRPRSVSILNQNTRDCIVDVNYSDDEFVVFTDQFVNTGDELPFMTIAWEFACKLHELDLAFNANSVRQRMPSILNNGSIDTDNNNTTIIIPNKGVSISEVLRSAIGRNEQFVEIPQSMIGHDGLFHESIYNDNQMPTHIDAQKKLYEAYFEVLGLYTNKDKKGVYTVKALQKNGDETGDYICEVMKETRAMCMREACLMFNINMQLEVL